MVFVYKCDVCVCVNDEIDNDEFYEQKLSKYEK